MWLGFLAIASIGYWLRGNFSPVKLILAVVRALWRSSQSATLECGQGRMSTHGHGRGWLPAIWLHSRFTQTRR